MIQIRGSKPIERTQKEIADIAREYGETILDIGTGDGRFVYENALKEPGKLFIGMDPAAKQLEIYAKRAARKKLHNALFIVGNIEHFPFDTPIIDRAYIILPWGSLLKTVSTPETDKIINLSNALRIGANLTIIFGYDTELEPSETERLELARIDERTVNDIVAPGFESTGRFCLLKRTDITKDELKEFSSTWSKKLGFGNERPIIQLIFKRC